MDESVRTMLEESYIETVQEALKSGHSSMEAHKEGVVAAAMLLASLTGVEDDKARSEVAALKFRPDMAA